MKYRAYFITGTVELDAADLKKAGEEAKEIGAEHFPGEKMISVATLKTTRPKRSRKKVSA